MGDTRPGLFHIDHKADVSGKLCSVTALKTIALHVCLNAKE